MKFRCADCGEDLEYYEDEEEEVIEVYPCEYCLDDVRIDSRGLGFSAGVEFNPDSI